jgi:hypothetical protein
MRRHAMFYLDLVAFLALAAVAVGQLTLMAMGML